MRARVILSACALALLSPVFLAFPHAQTPAAPITVEVLLLRVGRYVAEFTNRFSNVVAEESYIQETIAPVRPGPAPTSGRAVTSVASMSGGGARRQLKSDFLMVKPGQSEDYLPFRDVFEVDGSRVRDRDQRLARLFLDPKADAVERALQIASESSRYNLGNITRTINNPVLALAFLQSDLQKRFSFKFARPDAGVGPNVWIVEYREQERPTLIRGVKNKDMPASGRYWINFESGRVARTELSVLDAAVTARVTTDFQHDARFDADVPAKMTEIYLLSNGSQVVGTATYGRFRRFDVSTEETIETGDDKPRDP
jgi:hypothetical protein